MEIKTLGDFRKATEHLSDDFKLEVGFYEQIPEDVLKKMFYSYPFYRTKCTLEFNDVGYSDSVICLGVYKNE